MNKPDSPIPNLTHVERLELANTLLKRDLYKLQLVGVAEEHQRIVELLQKVDVDFKKWRASYSTKLAKLGMKFDEVDIDAETGRVVPNNVSELTKSQKPAPTQREG